MEKMICVTNNYLCSRNKTFVTTEIEDNDHELLKSGLPDNPCTKCPDYIGCLGCPRGNEYRNRKKQFEDANILDVAKQLREYNEMVNTVKELEMRMRRLLREMPDYAIPYTVEVKDLFCWSRDRVDEGVWSIEVFS